MRFLVDESVSRDIVDYLRSEGHDTLYIAEVARSTDDEHILRRAVDEKHIVVTNDKDFGELVFRSGEKHEGVLLFRLKRESAANQVQALSALLNQHPNHVVRHFVIVREDHIRIRGGMVLLMQPREEE